MEDFPWEKAGDVNLVSLYTVRGENAALKLVNIGWDCKTRPFL